MNQCDGCRRGLPLNEHGIHRGPGIWDIIGCTKSRYVYERVVNGGDIDPVVEALLDASQWFSVERLPDDQWLVTVKTENRRVLEDW